MNLLAAVAFLTVMPLPRRLRLEPRHLARATPWFPLVGLGLGAALAALDHLLGLLLPAPARNALLVIAAVALNGALHIDGLMDTCDGVFSATTPERRREIMRDSHVGSFGVAAGGLLLIGKFAALDSLGDVPRGAALVAMAVLGRWAMSLGVVLFPAGRADGLGRLVKDAARPADLLVAGGVALGVVALLFQTTGALLFLLVSLLAWWIGRALSSRLAGLTGDTYGALNELAELATLASAPVLFRLLSS